MIKHRAITVANRLGVENQEKISQKLLGLTYGELFEEIGKLHPIEILSSVQNFLAVTQGIDSPVRLEFSEKMFQVITDFCEGKTSFQDLKEDSDGALEALIVAFDEQGGDFEKICYKKEAIFEQVIV